MPLAISFGGREVKMLIGLYGTKAELERSIGQPLHYDDHDLLQTAYTPFGTLAVEGPPKGKGTRWTAEVTMVAGRIVRVE
jgi:hypothetical protein